MTKKIVLGLDTCTKWLNLALVNMDGVCLAEHHEPVQTHATRLLPALEGLLGQAGAGREGIVAIGAVVGPGSFTGLRIGLAAAGGLSRALGVPAFGLDSLTALAAAMDEEGPGVALLDARRGQVYAAAFVREQGDLRRITEPSAVEPQSILGMVPAPAWAAGDGVPLVSSWPEGTALHPEMPNLALPAAHEALARLLRGEPAEALAPAYVRPPDAKEPGRPK